MAKDKEYEKKYLAEKLRRSRLRKHARKIKKGNATTCPRCKKDVGYYVQKVINPYYYEMHDEIIWERMCQQCIQDSADCI